MIKDGTAFKRSRFASRFPFLEIEVFEKEVFVTDEPISGDVEKFINGVAKHAMKDSWIKVNDIDEKKTIIHRSDGDGSFTTDEVEYDPADEPDEFIPDDVEFIVNDVTGTENPGDIEKVDKIDDKKSDIFI